MSDASSLRAVATVLERPAGDYGVRLAQAGRAAGRRSIEAARQLDVFASRVADLSVEELQELYDETFAAGRASAVADVAHAMTHAGRAPGRCEAIDVLAPALVRLDADRNPFAYVVKALCCLLLSP
jgi:nitrate reductase assembly molybdenum cofactor insertion protein NarJ